jgi:hypothetical protein
MHLDIGFSRPRDEPFQARFDKLTTLSKIEGRAMGLSHDAFGAVQRLQVQRFKDPSPPRALEH